MQHNGKASTASASWTLVWSDPNHRTGLYECAREACKNLPFIQFQPDQGAFVPQSSEKSLIFLDGTQVDPAMVARLGCRQKLSKFCGMRSVAGDKCGLFRALNDMRVLFPDEFDFFPPTFCLPEDVASRAFRVDNDNDHPASSAGAFFLLKPSGGSQGRGIKIAPRHTVLAHYAQMCRPTSYPANPAGTTLAAPPSSTSSTATGSNSIPPRPRGGRATLLPPSPQPARGGWGGGGGG